MGIADELSSMQGQMGFNPASKSGAMPAKASSDNAASPGWEEHTPQKDQDLHQEFEKYDKIKDIA